MTLYLQRLLNRSAAPVLTAGLQPPALRPALPSTSPIFSFDQRLGDSDIASDYNLVGASPPELLPHEAAPDLWPETSPEAGPRDHRRPLSHPPASSPTALATPEPALDVNAPAKVEHPASSPPPPRRRSRSGEPIAEARAVAEAVPPPSRNTPPPLSASAPEVTENAAEPRVAPPEKHSARARPRPERANATSPDALLWRAEPAAAEGATTSADPVRTPSQPASRGEERQPPTASVETAHTVRGDTAAAATVAATPTAPTSAAAIARPIAVEAPPLEPAPPPIRLGDIERIVEEKLRSRLARLQAAAPPAAQPSVRAEEAVNAAPKRPATAAEASVIGKLDSSAFQPMLFGVRRR